MRAKPASDAHEHDLFRLELVNLIGQRHELVRLGGLIDWQAFESAWGPQFTSYTGRPALPTRLMAALLYLKHVYALSDEELVERWCENQPSGDCTRRRGGGHALHAGQPV
jgi:transposase, IS5 family